MTENTQFGKQAEVWKWNEWRLKGSWNSKT